VQLASYIMTISSCDDIVTNLNSFSVRIRSLTKFLIFRFAKKINDLVPIEPNITEIIISNETSATETFSDILPINIMGHRLFIVPFAQEIYDMETLKKCVKKCEFDSTLLELGYNRIKIVTDLLYDNYEVFMTSVCFNYAGYSSGMMGKMFCNY